MSVIAITIEDFQKGIPSKKTVTLGYSEWKARSIR